jgi:uncharacterized protein (DUF427 family)
MRVAQGISPPGVRSAELSVETSAGLCAQMESSNDNGAIMKAVWKDVVIAESPDTVVVEGNHYFPLASVNRAVLEPSTHTSVCPWKGTASYYTLNVNGERNANAVWYYPEPKDAARQIKGRVAFWKGVTVSG